MSFYIVHSFEEGDAVGNKFDFNEFLVEVVVSNRVGARLISEDSDGFNLRIDHKK